MIRSATQSLVSVHDDHPIVSRPRRLPCAGFSCRPVCSLRDGVAPMTQGYRFMFRGASGGDASAYSLVSRSTIEDDSTRDFEMDIAQEQGRSAPAAAFHLVRDRSSRHYTALIFLARNGSALPAVGSEVTARKQECRIGGTSRTAGPGIGIRTHRDGRFGCGRRSAATDEAGAYATPPRGFSSPHSHRPRWGRATRCSGH